MTSSAPLTPADIGYMRRAIVLARRVGARCRPNPMVGAVVVRNGRIIGQGAHLRAGGPHAEIAALTAAGSAAAGSTLYVTLEPCNHHGRTPPCTEAVIAAGISKVVIAMSDPNPHVAGGGAARLRAAGIEVTAGVLAEEARALNKPWLFSLRHGRPLLTGCCVLSLDGRLVPLPLPAVAAAAVGRATLQLGSVLHSISSLPAVLPAVQQGLSGISVVIWERTIDEAQAAQLEGVLSHIGPGSVLIAAESLSLGFTKRVQDRGVVVHRLQAGRRGRDELLQHLASLNVQGMLVPADHPLFSELAGEGALEELLVIRTGKLLGRSGRPLPAPTDKSEQEHKLTLKLAKRRGSSVISLYGMGRGLESFDDTQLDSAV